MNAGKLLGTRQLTENLSLVAHYAQVLYRAFPLFWVAAPREATFLTVTLLVEGLIPAVGVWINKQIVDAIAATLNSGSNTNIWMLASWVGGWAVAVFLESLLPPWRDAADLNLDEKLKAHLDLQLMRRANQCVDLRRFEEADFYDELQLLQEQVTYEPSQLLGSISAGFREVSTLMVMSSLLFPLGWWLPVLLIGVSLPQTYFSFRTRWQIWEATSDKSPQARQMRYYASILLSDLYAKEVRLFGLGSFFTERYLRAFQDKFQAMQHLRGQRAGLLTGLGVLSASGNAFAFFWVVFQAVNGRLSPGNVLLFVQSLAYIQRNFLYVLNSTSILQNSILFMERYFRFLDSKPTMTVDSPSVAVPTPIQKGIVFDQVSFHYPDGRVALSQISFHLRPGETVALVGENGAGKTTLVKLLARFYDPSQGRILVDQHDLRALDLEAWRRQIAVVFQDFARYSLTVRENIALGDLAVLGVDQPLRQASLKAGIASKIERLPDGYTTMLGKQFNGTELSGGEWQKVALARAFIRQDSAQILILDEPTAALDPRSEAEVYNRFAELVGGKTAILVTHRLASVKMADRILVLKAGKLIEQGSHTELLAQQGEYATLWNLQAAQYES